MAETVEHLTDKEWKISPTFRRVPADDIIICDQGGLLSITVASFTHYAKNGKVRVADVAEVELQFSDSSAKDLRDGLDEWLKSHETESHGRKNGSRSR